LGLGAELFALDFGGGAPAPRGFPSTTTVPRGAAAAARATAASRAPGTGGVTTGDGAGGAAPSNKPWTGNVEACRGGDAAGFGFLAAMRPQLSVCFAAPCSLANHLPHKRAQGVAPQASQLRNGITSAEGMVSSKVQIWQLTVWGKGFERQASAMVRSPLFLFFSGLGKAVRTGAGTSCLRVQEPSMMGSGTVASARDRLGVRGAAAAYR